MVRFPNKYFEYRIKKLYFLFCIHQPLASAHYIDPKLEEIPLKEGEYIPKSHSHQDLRHGFVCRMYHDRLLVCFMPWDSIPSRVAALGSKNKVFECRTSPTTK